MSLDVWLTNPGGEQVYEANITHNLTKMAAEAGIYIYCWHPDRAGCRLACEISGPIRKALALMKADPPRFEKFNSPNGWGLYEHFVPWLERYLEALEEHPKATIETST